MPQQSNFNCPNQRCRGSLFYCNPKDQEAAMICSICLTTFYCEKCYRKQSNRKTLLSKQLILCSQHLVELAAVDESSSIVA